METTDPLAIIFSRSPSSPEENWNRLSDIQYRMLLQSMHKAHRVLGQLDLPQEKRSNTAINYDSSIRTFFNYMRWKKLRVPDTSTLEGWKNDMLHGNIPSKYVEDQDGNLIGQDFRSYSVGTINARLAAVQNLLRRPAQDITDFELKHILKDWAIVRNVRKVEIQDKVDSDYGHRLNINEVKTYLAGIDTSTGLGLRDYALIAILVGTGIRIGEVIRLTVEDVVGYVTENDIPAIRVREGKGKKSRLVALKPDSWVLKSVQEYMEAVGITLDQNGEEPLIQALVRKRGHHKFDGTSYIATGNGIAKAHAHRIIHSYPATYKGKTIKISPHDLRRTYAKICHDLGMELNALRANMGHRHLSTTLTYIGTEEDLTKRIPNWSIDQPDKQDNE